MRVLLIHNRYQQAGGEDGVVKAERALLEAHGHECEEYLEDNHRVDEMSRLQVAARTVWSVETWRRLGNLLTRFRPHVAHVHNTFPLISPSVYHLLQSRGVPVVQTLHNYRFLCPAATFYREGRVCEDCLGKTFPWPSIHHACYRNNRGATAATASMLFLHRVIGTYQTKVDLYIALTEFARSKFIEGGLPASKIVIKPVFVQDHGIGTADGNYAVYIGRLTEEKGIRTLLEAWRVLGSKIALKIIGGGPLAGEVEQCAAQVPGVTYLGRAPDDLLRETLGRATFTVFPSVWYEGMPAVILESYAAGLPVVSSRLGGMAAMVKEAQTGRMFEPGNARDLVRAVETLLGNPAEYVEMRRLARREFEENYTAQQNYTILLSIYESILKRQPQTGQRHGSSGAS